MAKHISSIRDLIPDDLNSNLHSERGMDMLSKSITQNGIGRSILVDKNGKIIAGNGTTETLVELGLEEVQVVQTHGDKLVIVQRIDLDLDTDKKARQLAINDNRVAELNLQWNPKSLEALNEDGLDMKGLWTSKEMDKVKKELAKAFEDKPAILPEGTPGGFDAPGIPSGDFIGEEAHSINKASKIMGIVGTLIHNLSESDEETLNKVRPELIDLHVLLSEILEL